MELQDGVPCGYWGCGKPGHICQLCGRKDAQGRPLPKKWMPCVDGDYGEGYELIHVEESVASQNRVK